ncbi:hypothetical protein C8D87_1164 [Lentzea atacamensis]|uniref:Uncharacterized protein n=1 Tax=Lentzea atacamensis TaxID=531938 RepID=A0ABX9DV48_9PSEU|nr:hypothetical protein C8D87_1164 [Lentzea atacamensis]
MTLHLCLFWRSWPMLRVRTLLTRMMLVGGSIS